MSLTFHPDEWALILGGSTGIGLCTAERLARAGMSIAVVHRDRPSVDAQLAPRFQALGDRGRLLRFNLDALSSDGRTGVVEALVRALGPKQRVRVLLHSIAAGNLRPLAPARRAPAEAEDLLEGDDFLRTIDAMGVSLLVWTRALHARGLFAEDARVLGLTSEGSRRVWPNYAAVSAAKAALEALSRAIAVEYGPHGIRSNVIWAGVTDTPALRRIPGWSELLARKALENPLGRATQAEDIADVVSLLAADEARWINGAIVRVDGGEHLVE